LYKSNAGQRTFYYRIVNIWNNLDTTLKTSKSIFFKSYLKNKLIRVSVKPGTHPEHPGTPRNTPGTPPEHPRNTTGTAQNSPEHPWNIP